MKKLSSLFIFIVAPLMFWSIAQAGDVRDHEVRNFIDSMATIDDRSDEFPQMLGALDNIEDDMSSMVGDDGNIAMFRNIVREVKKNPTEKRKMLGIVSKSNFTTLERWGEVGDVVFAVYLREEIGVEDIGALVSMAPIFEAQVGPEAEEMRVVLRLAQALDRLNPQQISLVTPYLPRFRAVLEASE